MLYHGYQASNVDAGRVVYLDKITWGSDGWPQVQGMRPSTEADAPVFGTEAGISEKKTEQSYLINSVDGGGYFRIDSPDDNLFTWQLYNVSGRLVLNGMSRNIAVVDTSSIQRGLYMIRVNGTAGTYCGKVWRQ